METTKMIYLSTRGMKELKKQISNLENDRRQHLKVYAKSTRPKVMTSDLHVLKS
jgi:hypothetical protein